MSQRGSKQESRTARSAEERRRLHFELLEDRRLLAYDVTPGGELVALPDANFDNNQVVDGADFLSWARNFNSALHVEHAEVDANQDGQANSDDLMILQQTFGVPKQILEPAIDYPELRTEVNDQLVAKSTLAPLVVTTRLDVVDSEDGVLSLREAINSANVSEGADVIHFDDYLAGKTIRLIDGEIEISDELTIDGSSLAEKITIDAQQESRIFNVVNGPDDEIPGNNLTLVGLRLANGRTTEDFLGNGGAIRFFTQGVLSLENCEVIGNHTVGRGSDGGGVYAFGTLHLSNTLIEGNYTAGASADGGGIATSYGFHVIEKSIIRNNWTSGYSAQGAGVANSGGNLHLIESSVINNRTGGEIAYAGGIYSRAVAQSSIAVRLDQTLIAGNRTTGLNGTAAGVYVDYGGIEINHSTISGNVAERASVGGIRAEGNLSINSSTITENISRGFGAGIHNTGNYGDTMISNSTITGNIAFANSVAGGGIYFWGPNPLVVQNSIISGNSSDMYSDIYDGAFSLHSSYSLLGTQVMPVTGNGNIFSDNPQLAPLADNGGPTLTRAPLITSPVINAGDPSLLTGFPGTPVFDQRGLPFERISEGRIDIGAYEVQATPSPDLNEDGYVDGLDLGVLLGHWNTITVLSNGELDFLTPVNGMDLGIFLGAWSHQSGQSRVSLLSPLQASSTELTDAALAWTLASEAETLEEPFVGPLLDSESLPQDVALVTLLPPRAEVAETASLLVESDEETIEAELADELLDRLFG